MVILLMLKWHGLILENKFVIYHITGLVKKKNIQQ